MGQYIVTCECPCLEYNEIFLVFAENSKEAIDKVYKDYGQEYYKKDFKAKTIDSLFREDGNVVVLR